MIYFSEWRQSNAYRAYPFADDQSRVSVEQVELPTDFLVDAALYPPGVAGELYLRSVSGQTVVISVVGSTEVAATGTFNNSVCYLLDPLGRSAGVLVAGPGFSAANMTFSGASTRFAAACLLSPGACGVTGILLDDGTLLTGDVTLKAGKGVRLTQGNNVIGIDFVGGSESNCAVLGTPLKCVYVTVASGSMLRAVQSGNNISLSIAATREEICPLGKGLLEQKKPDFCAGIPTPTVVNPSLPAYTGSATCETSTGFIMLASASNSLVVESGETANSLKLRVRGLRNV